MDLEDYTVFVGNLDSKVTEEILYELFLQAGPLKSVKIPLDFHTKKPQRYGFVTYKHVVSVKYAIDLLNQLTLFNSPLQLSVKKKKGQASSVQEQKFNDSVSGRSNQFHNGSFHSRLPTSVPVYNHMPIQNGQEVYRDPNYSHSTPPAPYLHHSNSTPDMMQHCQQNYSQYSIQQQPTYSNDQRQNDTRRSRINPPHFPRESPSANDLKRSRSYHHSTPDYSRHRDERRYESRNSPSHHDNHDRRRVVRQRSRHSRHSPYNKSRSHRH